MAGIKYLKNTNEVIDMTGSEYTGVSNQQHATVFVKTGAAANATVKYGLTTDVTASAYSPEIKLSGSTVYIASQFSSSTEETTGTSYETEQRTTATSYLTSEATTGTSYETRESTYTYNTRYLTDRYKQTTGTSYLSSTDYYDVSVMDAVASWYTYYQYTTSNHTNGAAQYRKTASATYGGGGGKAYYGTAVGTNKVTVATRTSKSYYYSFTYKYSRTSDPSAATLQNSKSSEKSSTANANIYMTSYAAHKIITGTSYGTRYVTYTYSTVYDTTTRESTSSTRYLTSAETTGTSYLTGSVTTGTIYLTSSSGITSNNCNL